MYLTRLRKAVWAQLSELGSLKLVTLKAFVFLNSFWSKAVFMKKLRLKYRVIV